MAAHCVFHASAAPRAVQKPLATPNAQERGRRIETHPQVKAATESLMLRVQRRMADLPVDLVAYKHCARCLGAASHHRAPWAWYLTSPKHLMPLSSCCTFGFRPPPAQHVDSWSQIASTRRPTAFQWRVVSNSATPTDNPGDSARASSTPTVCQRLLLAGSAAEMKRPPLDVDFYSQRSAESLGQLAKRRQFRVG